MPKKTIVTFIFFLLLTISCTPSYYKNTSKHQKPTQSVVTKSSGKTTTASKSAERILQEADSYQGTRYLYGGNTRAGIDCSGLVYNAFAEASIKLPRQSSAMAEEGSRITLESVEKGDLVFFATMGGTKVSHVGIVHDVKENGEILFIHSSSSKGVTISSLSNNYWKNHFVKAKRIL